jgi:hypothetical protein
MMAEKNAITKNFDEVIRGYEQEKTRGHNAHPELVHITNTEKRYCLRHALGQFGHSW